MRFLGSAEPLICVLARLGTDRESHRFAPLVIVPATRRNLSRRRSAPFETASRPRSPPISCDKE